MQSGFLLGVLAVLTFKQLEAIYWVVRLGGFSPAAQKLHTTQSAISKRVQELEALLNTSLFDRSSRSAHLTEKGQEMYSVASRLLQERDSAIEQLAQPEVIERRLRIGVTELTAITWLPRLVDRIQTCWPRMSIEPEVETSVALRDKLLADELDLVIVPDAFQDARLVGLRVGIVAQSWMCKPGMVDASRTHKLHELAGYRLVLQSSKSGTGLYINHWLTNFGFRLHGHLTSSNMLALLGMAASGLGITYLPSKCLQPMIDAGMLQKLRVSPALPDTPYVVMYKRQERSTIVRSVAKLAQDACDFTSVFQPGGSTEFDVTSI